MYLDTCCASLLRLHPSRSFPPVLCSDRFHGQLGGVQQQPGAGRWWGRHLLADAPATHALLASVAFIHQQPGECLSCAGMD